jgi:hypothetical protein
MNGKYAQPLTTLLCWLALKRIFLRLFACEYLLYSSDTFQKLQQETWNRNIIKKSLYNLIVNMLLKLNVPSSTLYRRIDFRNVISSFSTAAASVEKSVVKKPKAPSKRKEMMEQKFPVMNVHEAVATIKKLGWANFDETIEISVNMGLDPRKPNQSVKGIAKLPSGSGKKVRILVFANGNDAQEAKDAGADVVGSDDLIAKIQGGDVNFNTIIATPELMATVGKVGKVKIRRYLIGGIFIT